MRAKKSNAKTTMQRYTIEVVFHKIGAEPDLAYYRQRTDHCGSSLAVAFVDIDHFKEFNTAHTETVIDRNVLPRFMQLVESHVHFHGHAYRQGGDEYLILLPNLEPRLAIDF